MPQSNVLWSGKPQEGSQELEIVDIYPTIAIGVESFERLSYLVKNNARAHEAVESDAWWRWIL